MSLESWKKKYYPVEASKVSGALEATLHSLRKWMGLQRGDLAEHGIELDDLSRPVDENGQMFNVDATTCALCELFYDGTAKEPCKKCPLAMARDGVSCDCRRAGEEMSPYMAWISNGNPQPMIEALADAIPYAMRKDLEDDREDA